jgi:hypothetical protein
LINARYGILAASEQLRHGGIAVTAKHYLENRQPSVLGLGHLLTGERTIVPMDGEADSFYGMTGKPQQRNRACVISTFQVAAEINGFQGRLSPNVATPRDPGDLITSQRLSSKLL